MEITYKTNGAATTKSMTEWYPAIGNIAGITIIVKKMEV